jgi:hypothetical protein
MHWQSLKPFAGGVHPFFIADKELRHGRGAGELVKDDVAVMYSVGYCASCIRVSN